MSAVAKRAAQAAALVTVAEWLDAAAAYRDNTDPTKSGDLANRLEQLEHELRGYNPADLRPAKAAK